MPNHITTRIKITGDPEAVKRVLNKIKNDEFGMGTIDFEKIIPMPKNIFKGNLGVRERELYGNNNWYDWSVANWGTKWDIYHDKITVGDLGWMEGCASIETEFDTAWSPPKCWLAKASELFPQLSFKLHFEEPGNYFAGDIFGDAGECSIDDYDGERLEQTFAYLRDEADE